MPVPYTNFSKSIPDLSFVYQKLEIGAIPYSKIVKVHTVLYTDTFVRDTISESLSDFLKKSQTPVQALWSLRNIDLRSSLSINPL